MDDTSHLSIETKEVLHAAYVRAMYSQTLLLSLRRYGFSSAFNNTDACQALCEYISQANRLIRDIAKTGGCLTDVRAGRRRSHNGLFKRIKAYGP